jgi:hypothetical protein
MAWSRASISIKSVLLSCSSSKLLSRFAYSVGANDQDLGAADLRKALCGANDFHRPILTVEPPAVSFLISSVLPVAR